MKDVSQIKNYRTKYKRFYNINFDERYVVHHIDFNRENNDISNLILLPKELHAKYHLVISAITFDPNAPKTNGILDFRLSNKNITFYQTKMLNIFPSVIEDCAKWIMYKEYKYDKSCIWYIFGYNNEIDIWEGK